MSFSCGNLQSGQIYNFKPKTTTISWETTWNMYHLKSIYGLQDYLSKLQKRPQWKSHLLWIRWEICTDQALFTSINSPKQSGFISEKTRDGLFHWKKLYFLLHYYVSTAHTHTHTHTHTNLWRVGRGRKPWERSEASGVNDDERHRYRVPQRSSGRIEGGATTVLVKQLLTREDWAWTLFFYNKITKHKSKASAPHGWLPHTKHYIKSRTGPLSSSTVVTPPFILPELLRGTRDRRVVQMSFIIVNSTGLALLLWLSAPPHLSQNCISLYIYIYI